MSFKKILNQYRDIYVETERFYHMKDSQLELRYYSNYIDYKSMPDLQELENDLTYLAKEQEAYQKSYAMLFFPENMDLPNSLEKHLRELGFDLSKHIIFTNQLKNLNLKKRHLDTICIEELSSDTYDAYLKLKYEQNLEFGKAFAEQMLTYNRGHLPEKGSRIYIAREGKQLIGDVTAWHFGDYVEIDDFSVLKPYRGKSIGSALQLQASQGYDKVILISEEENRAMYEHQGYEEVAYYWTVLKSEH